MPRYAAQIGSTLTGLRRSHAADPGNVGLELSSREIWAAVGFNSSLFGGSQAAAVRESWRLALFGVLSPLGRLVETELRAKLGDVTLDWSELRASDLSGRARAFQSMVGGGMPVADAVAIAGLMVDD